MLCLPVASNGIGVGETQNIINIKYFSADEYSLPALLDSELYLLNK